MLNVLKCQAKCVTLTKYSTYSGNITHNKNNTLLLFYFFVSNLTHILCCLMMKTKTLHYIIKTSCNYHAITTEHPLYTEVINNV